MLIEDTIMSPGEHVDRVGAAVSPSHVRQWTFAEFAVTSTFVDGGSGFALHRHEEDQLAWMASGSMEVSVGSDRWHLRRDHAAWIPTGVLHEMRFTEPGELVSAYVDQRHRPSPEGWNRARVLTLDPLAGALLRYLAAEGRRETRRQECFGLLSDLIAEAPVSREVVALPQDPRARAIAVALLAAPDDDRDLDAWAAQEGVSAKTIARAFVSDTGRTFREWRVRARLHVAVGLLVQGAPVHEVALAVGYDSVSSFISAFRSRFGMTPAAYAGRTREIDV
ncbi:AraC family transcriptional regulator [Microbacterium sp. Kw_RZR3]|uniref:helix-turn-helix transcriptional regulator n=1 Tax=Microbacterium sp. Kw_RZR3 TaxID=3032903 RepID=UPI0023DA53C0|nr:AraC family transcriptional regulator [Microbacterium sp. Kw_RZR3]MDF2046276.1 AraC family transcriptional regulator [Microbacterium sp. Kw_RZR3]